MIYPHLRKLVILNSILILLLFGVVIWQYFNKPKFVSVRYIDNIELFNNFSMSKDLSKIHNNKINKQAHLVDSLYSVFQQDIKNKKKEILLKSDQLNFQKENQKLQEMQEYFTKNVSQQVWNRLHIYIHDFAIQQNIKLILGSQRNGTIMYGDSIINITDDLLTYCNNKYEGVPKTQ